METNKSEIKIIYVVNAKMPTMRAHAIQIANTCSAMGKKADVTLITPIFSGRKMSLATHFGIQDTFQHKRIFAIDIPKFPFQFHLRSITFFISVNVYLLVSLFISLLKREKIAVYARGEVVFSLILISFVLPVLFETHQIRNHEKIYRFILSRMQGIVVITDRLKKKFVDEYNISSKKILVARDSVDLAKFSNAERNITVWQKYEIPQNKKIVLYCGSLGKEKGVHTLADSAKFLDTDTHVVFIGGNEDQVGSFKKKYKSIKNVSILGQVEHTRVPEYVASADVLVLPDLASDRYANLYTSPMKLFEYMATGQAPIVASNIPSLREVLTTDSSFFFESGNPHSLATSINQALYDEQTSSKLAEKAQDVVSEFTWEKRGKRIVEHINKCLIY